MARLRKKNLSHPDEVRPVGRGRLEIVELGDMTVGRITYQPGWRWSEDVKPLVGTDSCEVQHVGVVLRGVLHVEMDDGSTMDLTPDDTFDVPPGHDAWVIGAEPWVSLDTVGRRHFAQQIDPTEGRILATILFTDLVGSTEMAARLGDSVWRERLGEYHLRVRAALDRFRGRQVESTGDGVFGVFDSPARAARCALELDDQATELGLLQRAGIHTGEVERVGEELRGIAVHVAARVAAAAGPHEVLASPTTAALLAGSGMGMVNRGSHQLRGIDEPMDLFAILSSGISSGSSGTNTRADHRG